MYVMVSLFMLCQIRVYSRRCNIISLVFPCRPRLSANVAYKHSSVVPRDADIQNHRIFVGKSRS